MIGVEGEEGIDGGSGEKGLAAQLAGGFREVDVRVGQDLAHEGVELRIAGVERPPLELGAKCLSEWRHEHDKYHHHDHEDEEQCRAGFVCHGRASFQIIRSVRSRCHAWRTRLVPCGRCMRYHHPMGYRGAGLVSEEDTRNGKTCPEPPGGTCDNAVIADDTGAGASLDDSERSGPGC